MDRKAKIILFKYATLIDNIFILFRMDQILFSLIWTKRNFGINQQWRPETSSKTGHYRKAR